MQRLRHTLLTAGIAALVALLIWTQPLAAAPVKVYLLAGQSNMQGVGVNSELSPPYSHPQTDVNFWAGSAWAPLSPGFGVNGTNFGPEVSFGRAIKDANPGDEIYLIKHAVSGTALYNDWDPGSGPQHTAFVNAVDAALTNLDNASIDYEIAGMIWMQGESDAIEGQGAAYEANLTAFIADMRSRYSTPDMPFVIGRILPGWANSGIVRTAQQAVGEDDAYAAWIDTDGFDESGLHYNTQGQIDLGIAFAQGLEAAHAPAPSAAIAGTVMLGAMLTRRRRP